MHTGISLENGVNVQRRVNVLLFNENNSHEPPLFDSHESSNPVAAAFTMQTFNGCIF